MGDVNCDLVLDVLDVVQLVSFILGSGELDEDSQALADINNDSFIDVIDIVQLVAIILAD